MSLGATNTPAICDVARRLLKGARTEGSRGQRKFGFASLSYLPNPPLPRVFLLAFSAAFIVSSLLSCAPEFAVEKSLFSGLRARQDTR